jgi:GT2 family glycosyltransferase
MTTSILVPSYRRPQCLFRCLQALASQTTLPGEVFVVWQGHDSATRDVAEDLIPRMPFDLRVLHNPEPGIVPSENLALEQAQGLIILLIDDDAVAPPDWVARHLRFYTDDAIGAVGGIIDNFRPDGAPFPKRDALPNGTITWFGKLNGNLYDHPREWRARQPHNVAHLAGGNMSLRRDAFHKFEDRLLPYWQLFEADACLQVKERGYRVYLDFGNVVSHYPTNCVYDGTREGDLDRKVFHSAFNHAFILARYSVWWLRPARLGYLILVGSVISPGLLAFFFAVLRYGNPVREARVLVTTARYHLAGWAAGAQARAGRPAALVQQVECSVVRN